MKLQTNIQSRPRRMNSPGFTLVEMMVSTWIYTIIFVAMVIAIQIFGLRVYTLAATKVSATAGCLKAMNGIRDQIREAKTLDVGSCNSTPDSFASLSTNNYQQGNALRIFPTTNTATYMTLYLDASIATNCNLKQFTVASNAANTALITNTATLASYITNQDIFTAQDYQGNILTNDNVTANRMIVYVKMQFYQWEYPIAFVGGVGLNAYDFFQLQTRITRRATN
jgi:type II secretory pathway pseudopilin PulG